MRRHDSVVAGGASLALHPRPLGGRGRPGLARLALVLGPLSVAKQVGEHCVDAVARPRRPDEARRAAQARRARRDTVVAVVVAAQRSRVAVVVDAAEKLGITLELSVNSLPTASSSLSPLLPSKLGIPLGPSVLSQTVSSEKRSERRKSRWDAVVAARRSLRAADCVVVALVAVAEQAGGRLGAVVALVGGAEQSGASHLGPVDVRNPGTARLN